MSSAVCNDLINSKQIGHDWCEEFKQACFTNGQRFEKPIQRRKIKNFSSEAVKVCTTKTNKLTEVRGTRDLYGRLLYLAVNSDINLEVIFEYPLSPIPL